MEELQGWHPDPTGRHEERYFSKGGPTRLWRDGRTEGYDEMESVNEAERAMTQAPSPEVVHHAESNGDSLASGTTRVLASSQPEPPALAPAVSPSPPSSPAAVAPAVAPAPAPVIPMPLHDQAAPLPAAGWYPVDDSAQVLRWWDGERWGTTKPATPPPLPWVGPEVVVRAAEPAPAVATPAAPSSNGFSTEAAAKETAGSVPASVSTPEPPPPSGWYPVPGHPELIGWWDGRQWGETRAAGAIVPEPVVEERAGAAPAVAEPLVAEPLVTEPAAGGPAPATAEPVASGFFDEAAVPVEIPMALAPSRAGHKRSRVSRRLPVWSKMTWVVVVFNVAMLGWIVAASVKAHSAGNCAQQLGANLCSAARSVGVQLGLGVLVVAVVWAAGELVLGTLWLVTRGRSCVVCARTVQRGLVDCPHCGADFRSLHS